MWELRFNFRIQNDRMVLVETEGSHTKQIMLDSLDACMLDSPTLFLSRPMEALQIITLWQLVKSMMSRNQTRLWPLVCYIMLALPHLQVGLIHSIFISSSIKLHPLGNIFFLIIYENKTLVWERKIYTPHSHHIFISLNKM